MTTEMMEDLEAMEEIMCMTADRADIWQDRFIYAMARAIFHLLIREAKHERE